MTAEEKRDFVLNVYHQNQRVAEDLVFYIKRDAERSPFYKAYFPPEYSSWKVEMIECNWLQNGFTNLLVSNSSYPDGFCPLRLYTFCSNRWFSVPVKDKVGSAVVSKSLVETATGCFRLCELPSLHTRPFPDPILSFETEITRKLRSSVPGAPQKPFITLEQCRASSDVWLSLIQKGFPWKEIRATCKPELLPSADWSGVWNYYNIYEKIEYFVLALRPEESFASLEGPVESGI